MQVVYRNNLEDIIALQRKVLRHSRLARKMILHRFLFVEAILLLICFLLMLGNPPQKVLVFFIAISALAWVFRERSLMHQFKKDMKGQLLRDPNAAFKQKTTLILDEAGLKVENTGGVTTHPWDEVEHVGRDDRYLYVITDGMRHYVIPKAAFGGNAQSEAFSQELEARRTHGG